MSGVKYIDLENINLVSNGSPVSIEGIYNRIRDTRKHVILTNVKFDGIKRHDIDGSLTLDGNSYNIVQTTEKGIYIFKISKSDDIKLISKTWAQLNA